MASKRGQRRKQCSRKQRFASSELAADAMHAVIRAGKTRGGLLHIYKCQFCNGYHFGHARHYTGAAQ
jgi:hypothetical protein